MFGGSISEESRWTVKLCPYVCDLLSNAASNVFYIHILAVYSYL